MKNDNIDKGNIYKPIYYGNWEEKILYDLAVWKNGLAFKNINFTDIGKPVIKIAELKNGITSQTKFTQDIFDDSVCLTKGDMLFSWSGNPETSIDVFYYDLPDGWLNQHIFKITTKDDVFYKYFFYILKYLKPNFTVIATNKQTTGLGHVTINDLKRIKIKLPPLEEQKKIASILSSLDDKIELNNRMNKILEETAQTIFKEWFINFNFPNEEGKPYKKSGGKMIESELGEIPDGWEVTTLENISTIITKGTTPKKFTLQGINYIKVENILDNHSIDKSKLSFIDSETHNNLLKRSIIKEKDILFSIAGTLAKFAFVTNNILPANTNQAIAIIRVDSNIINPLFVFNFFLADLHKEHCFKNLQQSVQPNLSLTTIRNLKLIFPESKILKKYEDSILHIFYKIYRNIEENQKLAGIRDSILPKLMSGEIRIK